MVTFTAFTFLHIPPELSLKPNPYGPISIQQRHTGVLSIQVISQLFWGGMEMSWET